jgi:outer membrane protein assembly factor BamE (lipoprotein component of BamABCDE complex)
MRAWLLGGTCSLLFALFGCAQDARNHYSSAFLNPGITDATVASVQVDMNVAQLQALLGQPYQRIRFDNLRATAWDYRFVDTWGYLVELAVMVDDQGKVINKISKRVLVDDH